MAVSYYRAGYINHAITHLGKGLHALQDMYAHIDWPVEIGEIKPHIAYIETLGCVVIDRATGDFSLFDNDAYDLFYEVRLIERPVYTRTGNEKKVDVSYRLFQEGLYIAREGSERITNTKKATTTALLNFITDAGYDGTKLVRPAHRRIV